MFLLLILMFIFLSITFMSDYSIFIPIFFVVFVMIYIFLLVRGYCSITTEEQLEVIHVENIPIYNFVDCEFVTGEPPECPICMTEMIVCCELQCKHHFHKECIENWVKTHNTCPMCRQEILYDLFGSETSII